VWSLLCAMDRESCRVQRLSIATALLRGRLASLATCARTTRVEAAATGVRGMLRRVCGRLARRRAALALMHASVAAARASAGGVGGNARAIAPVAVAAAAAASAAVDGGALLAAARLFAKSSVAVADVVSCLAPDLLSTCALVFQSCTD
jgi:hypothetical protein